MSNLLKVKKILYLLLIIRNKIPLFIQGNLCKSSVGEVGAELLNWERVGGGVAE